MPINTNATKAQARSHLVTLAQRRQKFAQQLGNGVAIIVAAPRSNNHAVAYSPNSNLLYLSGCSEPDSALVIVVSSGKIAEEYLYLRARDARLERWEGRMLGPAAARRLLGIATTKPWPGIREICDTHLRRQSNVYLEIQSPDNIVRQCMRSLQTAGKTGKSHDLRLHDLSPFVGRLRMIKDRAEIAAIKHAAAVTVAAYLRMAAKLSQARYECELAAELISTYVGAGGEHAFLPIVACGANACIAHYVTNQAKLARGKLILVDTGCKISGYTADMTRVLPVAGRFNTAQRDLHAIVVAAQEQALAKVKPDNTLSDANHAASLELARGLVQLKICSGQPAKVIKSAAFARYYFHSIGHMLGMEVHDCNISTHDQQPQRLQANMVVTIEPGLYLDADSRVPQELRNTGIRIEDTVAVTTKGYDNLTATAPKCVSDVELLLATLSST